MDTALIIFDLIVAPAKFLSEFVIKVESIYKSKNLGLISLKKVKFFLYEIILSN